MASGTNYTTTPLSGSGGSPPPTSAPRVVHRDVEPANLLQHLGDRLPGGAHRLDGTAAGVGVPSGAGVEAPVEGVEGVGEALGYGWSTNGAILGACRSVPIT